MSADTMTPAEAVAYCTKIGDAGAQEELREAFSTSSDRDARLAVVVSLLEKYQTADVSDEKAMLVLSKACRALGNLCVYHLGNRVAVQNAGGITALLAVCTQFCAEPEVSKMACGALSNISAGDNVGPAYSDSKWVQPLVAVLTACVEKGYTQDVRVLVALRSFGNVCGTKPAVKLFLEDKKGVEILAALGNLCLQKRAEAASKNEAVDTHHLIIRNIVLAFSCIVNNQTADTITSVGQRSTPSFLIHTLPLVHAIPDQDGGVQDSLLLLRAMFTAAAGQIEIPDTEVQILLEHVLLLSGDNALKVKLGPKALEASYLLPVLASRCDANVPHYLSRLTVLETWLDAKQSKDIKLTGSMIIAQLSGTEAQCKLLSEAGICTKVLAAALRVTPEPLGIQLMLLSALRNMVLYPPLAVQLAGEGIIPYLVENLQVPVEEQGDVLRLHFSSLQALKTLMLLPATHKQTATYLISKVQTVTALVLSDAQHVRWEASRLVARLCTPLQQGEQAMDSKILNSSNTIERSVCNDRLACLTQAKTAKFMGILACILHLSTSKHAELQKESAQALFHLVYCHTDQIRDTAKPCVTWTTDSLTALEAAKTTRLAADSKNQNQDQPAPATNQKFTADPAVYPTLAQTLISLFTSTDFAARVYAIGIVQKLCLQDAMAMFMSMTGGDDGEDEDDSKDLFTPDEGVALADAARHAQDVNGDETDAVIALVGPILGAKTLPELTAVTIDVASLLDNLS